MIKLSNGFSFEFMTGSGVLGYDGKGWPRPKFWPLRFYLEIYSKQIENVPRVIKTLTLERIEGQIKAIYDGNNYVVNAVGLHNPGIKTWKEKYLPRISPNIKIVLSITERDLSRLGCLCDEVAKIVRDRKNIIGVEFNPSCPNVENFRKTWSARTIRKGCRLIKEKLPQIPLGLKIGYHQTYLPIALKTQEYVEWLSFNAIPWDSVFPNQTSPLEKKFHVKGAVSGGAIFELNKKTAKEIKETGVKTPIIASSVGWKKTLNEAYQEILDILKACEWADAISFSSLFRKHLLWPVKMILKYQKEKKPQQRQLAPWWLRQ